MQDMEESNIILFFGRFHPLLVHLPIGFLLLAVLLEVAERLNWVKEARSAIIFTLLLGVLSAIAASVLGLMLATSNDYNEDMLDAHKWAGFATTGVAILACLIKSDILKPKQTLYFGVLGVMVIAMSATGHLGGNLTHGTDYLTYYMPFKPKVIDPLERPAVTNLKEVQIFGDMVHPIIKAKCMSCHNDQKKKGQLSFASIDDYLTGGKHGELLVPGNPSISELIHRISLPTDHEDVMPPEGKTPLTEEEIAILTYWVEKGNASFDVMLDSLDENDAFLALANSYFGFGSKSQATQLRFAPVDSSYLQELRDTGFEIRELMAGSNALDVILPATLSDSSKIDQYMQALLPIKANIYWLSLNGTSLNNSHLEQIGSFEQVRNLKLANNSISDEGVKHLSGLHNLVSINLFGTQVTMSSIQVLGSLQSLESLYVWKSSLSQEDLKLAQEQFPSLKIVGGI